MSALERTGVGGGVRQNGDVDGAFVDPTLCREEALRMSECVQSCEEARNSPITDTGSRVATVGSPVRCPVR